jgi:hypothetical protein
MAMSVGMAMPVATVPLGNFPKPYCTCTIHNCFRSPGGYFKFKKQHIQDPDMQAPLL